MPILEFECQSCGDVVDVLVGMTIDSDAGLEPCDKCGAHDFKQIMPSSVVTGHRIGGELSHKPMGKGAEYAMRRNAKSFEKASESDKERYTFPKNRNKEFDPVTPKRVF